MSEQLSLFTELDFDLEFYDVVFYSGRMKDTNGDEIYFVRTVKHSLTKYQAENYCRDMNKKLFPGSSDYFDIIKRGYQFDKKPSLTSSSFTNANLILLTLQGIAVRFYFDL